MGRWTIVNALLAVIVALLGFEIVRTWGRGLPPVQVPANAAPVPAGPAPHEKGKRSAADKAAAHGPQAPAALVEAIVEKDLFDPSRRPPTPEEVKVDATPITKPPDNVVVVGVRILGNDREVFVNDGSQTPAVGRRLRAGDQISGYTIKKIEATGVVLSSPSGDLVAMPLNLDKGKAGTAARGPTPGRPPPAPVAMRPGQAPPAAGASPALGARGASPAAGVPVAPATPTPTPPMPVPAVPAPAVQPVPGQPPQVQQLGTEARQKLDQLRQNEKRPGRRR